MKNIFYLILIISWASCKSSAVSDTTVRKDYKANLAYALKNVNELDGNKIELSIPVSYAESLLYFSSDYNKELSKSFQALQQKTLQLCVEGRPEILERYLNLSEFVDGYFAEGYFDSVEKIMNAQKTLTCSTLSKSDWNKTKRLDELKKQYCQ